MTKITVAGMGYVGLANAVLLAQHNEVEVLDTDEGKKRLLRSNISPVKDPQIEAYLRSVPLHLGISDHPAEAYLEADYIIIAVPTDSLSGEDGFDTSLVEAVLEQIRMAGAGGIIVIRSTVPIGFLNRMIKRYPGGRILFVPEFLREGKALYDNLHPQRIVIGIPPGDAFMEAAAHRFAERLLEGAEEKEVPVLYTAYGEAEAVKLFSNMYLAMRVAFFNELDTYAEMNGMDTGRLIKGLGYDARIGDYYNNPSFGYGGYCLPKDTRQLLVNFASVPNDLVRAVVDSNKTRKLYIANRIQEILSMQGDKEGKVVGIYRLTMKTDSDNFRQSAVCDVMENLTEAGIQIVIFEPAVRETQYCGIKVVDNLEKFKQMSDLVVANRCDSALDDIWEKVYSRDIYRKD